MNAVTLFEQGLIVGEGPRYWGGSCWWVDIIPGRVFRCPWDAAGPGQVQCWDLHDQVGMVGMLAPTASQRVLLACQNGFFLLDPSDNSCTPIGNPLTHPEHRFNDGAVDPDGRLLVGSMPIDMPAGAGQLWSLEYDGSAMLRRQGLTCPNGLAWINGGAQLVAIDSPERCIQIFTYDRETGSIGAEIRRIDCSEFTGVPDGCCLDRNGGLWVAFWGGGCVRRFDLSDDSVSEQIACPTSQITACAFVGPERDRLLITSAAIDLDEPQAGHCFVCDLGNTAYRGDDAQAWAGPIP